jgi:response regulator RpfG family c-di-GMP phosphodiesterase
MHTLIIAPPDLKKDVEQTLTEPDMVLWEYGLDGAISSLESADVDAVVFDMRSGANSCAELKSLLSNIPVTTRVLAIVEQLPEEEMFAESGVVYLTPPVNVDDIIWFVRSRTHSRQA